MERKLPEIWIEGPNGGGMEARARDHGRDPGLPQVGSHSRGEIDSVAGLVSRVTLVERAEQV